MFSAALTERASWSSWWTVSIPRARDLAGESSRKLSCPTVMTPESGR